MNYLDACSNACSDHPGGLDAVAGRMSRPAAIVGDPPKAKSVSSLYHELSGQSSAKLGAQDAIKIYIITRDGRIPQAHAAACGGVFIPLPSDAPDLPSTLQTLADLARDFSGVLTAATLAAADGHITANELQNIERQFMTLMGTGTGMMAAFAAAHEAGKPAFVRGA